VIVGAVAVRAAAAIALVVSAVVAEVRAQRGDDVAPTVAIERRLALLTAMAVLVATVGAPLELVVAPRPAPVTSLIAGIVVAVAGIALRARAIRVLGDAFVTPSEGPDGAQLVARDVYAWVRHPSETGLVLLSAGMTLLTSSVAAAVATLGVLLLAVVRTRIEDRALSARHGDAHRRYLRDVGGLVPSLAPRGKAR
jgi:protein-S-isoprenylcysteine O-methyltransferase Ste14